MKKLFGTKFGYFSQDGREYIITDPRTPRPWINVISNGDYGLIVSQTGGGYSWRTHAQLNRITRWEQDLIKDEWGKHLYLRDDHGNIWSAGWKPVCAEPDEYRCTHGIGYSIIESLTFGIHSRYLVFVPPDDPMEVWHLALRNTTRRTRTLSVFTYFEWGLGAAPDWHREFHKSFIETRYAPKARALLATKRLWEVPTDHGHWNTDWPFVAFHSSSVRPSSYDADKESFLGMYGSTSMPAAVTTGRLRRRTGNSLDPIASLHVKVTLKPGEEKSVILTLGAADSPEQASKLAAAYDNDVAVRRSLARVRDRWDAMLSTVEVESPDKGMNLMENVWLKYQAISGRLWGRTAYYQTGGAYGFRDQLQDSQIFLPIEAARTKRQILLHAAHQFADGTVYHWWHPISEVGLRNQITDNLLWLPFLVRAFLDETADFSLLDEPVRFVDDSAQMSVYEHCTRAIRSALSRFSPRGLPLIGGGDWNDGLSAVGLGMKGESIWLGHFLHRILVDFADVARRRDDVSRAEEYRDRATHLREALNGVGWDGEWYYGATKDSGEKIGSAANSEGSVWLNPQSWAVIGGVADRLRGDAVFKVIESKLETDIGPLLLAPAYQTPDVHVGYLTRYAPGMRENGGVYTHGATWTIIAAAMLGKGEAAFRIYEKLLPPVRGMNPLRYVAEPYVTPGNIEGPGSPFFGRGGWTWYSGSATWLFKAGLEWILGIRPTIDGLIVDPCIPPTWSEFRVRRMFRGATYMIRTLNPSHVECGVSELVVDGSAVPLSDDPRRTLLPTFEEGSTHQITVTLGLRT
jgi:cellobiose phosphorylase